MDEPETKYVNNKAGCRELKQLEYVEEFNAMQGTIFSKYVLPITLSAISIPVGLGYLISDRTTSVRKSLVYGRPNFGFDEINEGFVEVPHITIKTDKICHSNAQVFVGAGYIAGVLLNAAICWMSHNDLPISHLATNHIVGSGIDEISDLIHPSK